METCEICTLQKKLATLKPCNHKACTECYFKLMKYFKVCPFCKTKLTCGKLTNKSQVFYTEITVEDLEKKILQAIRNMKVEINCDSDSE
jgi:hypothetical protein